jgi:hypothetical protein
VADDQELVTPYCGGCGHLYFAEAKITLAEAREKAKTRRCHYCDEDAAEDEKRRQRDSGGGEVYWFDPEW